MAQAHDRPALTWALRVFLLLNFVSALGFIIYSFILESPPKTSLPLGLLIIGIFSLVAVAITLLGSCRVPCCLSIGLVLGAVLTLAELGITLSMFFNYGNTVDDIWRLYRKSHENADESDKESIRQKVKNGRWFFLVVCILQAISVILTLVLRMCVYPRERDFESFDENGNANEPGASNSQIQMHKLQQSIGRNQPSMAHSPGTAAYASNKLNKSTTQKMAAKYGEFTQEFKSKGFFGKMFSK